MTNKQLTPPPPLKNLAHSKTQSKAKEVRKVHYSLALLASSQSLQHFLCLGLFLGPAFLFAAAQTVANGLLCCCARNQVSSKYHDANTRRKLCVDVRRNTGSESNFPTSRRKVHLGKIQVTATSCGLSRLLFCLPRPWRPVSRLACRSTTLIASKAWPRQSLPPLCTHFSRSPVRALNMMQSVKNQPMFNALSHTRAMSSIARHFSCPPTGAPAGYVTFRASVSNRFISNTEKVAMAFETGSFYFTNAADSSISYDTSTLGTTVFPPTGVDLVGNNGRGALLGLTNLNIKASRVGNLRNLLFMLPDRVCNDLQKP
eukprot:g1217.t1